MNILLNHYSSAQTFLFKYSPTSFIIARFMNNASKAVGHAPKLLALSKLNKTPNSVGTLSTVILYILSIIYPSIWGLYFSLSRYIRMGSTLDIYHYFSSISIDWYILIPFLLRYIIVWLAIYRYLLGSLRLTLWSYTEAMLYKFHIKALQYYIYFRLCELIYKGLFVYFDIISGNSGASIRYLKDCGIIRRTISYMFYRPYILHLIFVLSLLLELVLTKGELHYGVYSLFLYPFILGLIHCLHQFGYSNFIRDVCMSDYCALNFTKPRYYNRFWFYLPRAEHYFGFEYTYPEDLKDVIQRTVTLEESFSLKKNKQLNDLRNRLWGRRHIFNIEALKSGRPRSEYSKNIITGLPHRWSIRIAGFYHDTYKIRWYHTTKVLYNPLNKLHPLTIKFVAHDPYTVLALLNHPANNFSHIQRLTKHNSWPSPEELYKPSNLVIPHRTKTLIDVLEVNFIHRFKSLANDNVILGTYKSMKEKYGHVENSMQMRPDMVSYWLDSYFKFKGYLGTDQKEKQVTHYGRNQVITNPETNYHDILTDYKLALKKKLGALTPELEDILKALEATSNDPDVHIRTWAESIHLFPEKWIPPLLLNKTFDESQLKPEIIDLLLKANITLKKISDKLYELSVPETEDFFDDSLIQKMMREDV